MQHAIWAGDSSTAVSIIELDYKQFDAGRILDQREIVRLQMKLIESLQHDCISSPFGLCLGI